MTSEGYPYNGWFKSRKIYITSTTYAYHFDVGFRSEYSESRPEILLRPDELDKMSEHGKIVGIVYYQKDNKLRVTVRRVKKLE
jgi:hypothetical protein